MIMGFIPLLVWSRHALPSIQVAMGKTHRKRKGCLRVLELIVNILFTPLRIVMLPSQPPFWNAASRYVYGFRYAFVVAWIGYFSFMINGILNLTFATGMPDVFGNRRNNMPRTWAARIERTPPHRFSSRY